jgi:response regulator RpfG family c-di-GMP phosphodiesterase
MNDAILIIDDDPNLLAAMRRQLRDRFTMKTATSGDEAVVLLGEGKEMPAVVLCDMRMGGIDGIQTLRKVRELAPDAIRMMLTGNADLQTAIDAINDGNIFRFLTKPCAPQVLEGALVAALEQHRLITAERELLEQTLAGSIKVLSDMLALAFPEGYRRATRIYGWVHQLAAAGAIAQRWELNLAAMLAPIGMVSLPEELLGKMRSGARLSEIEHAQFDRTPEIARNIIANIPRLRGVAEILYLQNKGFDGSGFPAGGPIGTDIPFDARLLKILNDLSRVSEGTRATRVEFAVLEANSARYDPVLLSKSRAALEVADRVIDDPRLELRAAALRPGMVLAEDIVTKNGLRVLVRETPLSQAHIERLRHLAQYAYIKDRMSVVAARKIVLPGSPPAAAP